MTTRYVKIRTSDRLPWRTQILGVLAVAEKRTGGDWVRAIVIVPEDRRSEAEEIVAVAREAEFPFPVGVAVASTSDTAHAWAVELLDTKGRYTALIPAPQ